MRNLISLGTISANYRYFVHLAQSGVYNEPIRFVLYASGVFNRLDF